MSKKLLGNILIVFGVIVVATGIYEWTRGNDGLAAAVGGAFAVGAGSLLRKQEGQKA